MKCFKRWLESIIHRDCIANHLSMQNKYKDIKMSLSQAIEDRDNALKDYHDVKTVYDVQVYKLEQEVKELKAKKKSKSKTKSPSKKTSSKTKTNLEEVYYNLSKKD